MQTKKKTVTRKAKPTHGRKDAKMRTTPPPSVPVVDTMRLPDKGKLTVHQSVRPGVYRCEVRIPLGKKRHAIIAPRKSNSAGKECFTISAQKKDAPIVKVSGNFTLQIAYDGESPNGSFLSVSYPHFVELDTTSGAVVVPPKHKCTFNVRILGYNRKYYEQTVPAVKGKSDKWLLKNPSFAPVEIKGNVMCVDCSCELPKKNAAKNIPTANDLEEYRYRFFLKHGYTTDVQLMKEIGIKKKVTPLPKAERTREKFNELDMSVKRIVKNIMEQDKRISDHFFGGKPIEVLSEKQHSMIVSMRNKGNPISQIASATGLRPDTIAFDLAGGNDSTLHRVLLEADLAYARRMKDTDMENRTIAMMVNTFNIRRKMDMLLARDGKAYLPKTASCKKSESARKRKR